MSAAVAGSHRLSDTALAWLLGAIAMLGPFAIDTFFPAFPVVARELGASPAALQQTISVYLLGFALASLLHGPWSDSYGRRPVLIVSLLGFTLASVGCVFAATLTQLLWFRLAQGFCAAGGTVILRAIIRDRYDGPAAQRAMSQITLIFAAAPVIAPIIGGVILHYTHWRGIFVFVLLFGLGVSAGAMLLLQETHPAERRIAFTASSLIRGYWRLAKDAQGVWLVLAAAFNFSGLFLFIASAPVVVLELWHLTISDFWKLFVFAIGGILVGSQLSGLVAGRWSDARTVATAYVLMALGCASHLLYGALVSQPSWPLAAVPILLYGSGSSLAFPTLTIKLMDRYPDRRGAAASLQAFASLGVNAVVAGAVSPFVSHHTFELALAQSLLMLTGYAGWRAYRRGEKRAAAQFG